MKQVSYVLPLRKIGKCLAIILPQNFTRAFKLKEDDLGVPCEIPMTEDEVSKGMTDDVLGKSHLVIRIHRLKGNDIYAYLEGDLSE